MVEGLEINAVDCLKGSEGIGLSHFNDSHLLNSIYSISLAHQNLSAVSLRLNLPNIFVPNPPQSFPTTDNMSSDDDSSKVVELEAGLSKRFYETVLFLHCLKEVMVKAESVKEPEADLESNTGRSPRDSFRCFVNKLGQICDSGIRGKTVTAFAVLQPNQIQYRFASNQRTSKELKDVKTFIAAILDVLGSTHDDQLNGVFGTILERVLAFNRTAIEQYVKNLTRGETLDFCEKRCKEEDTAEGKNIHQYIRDNCSRGILLMIMSYSPTSSM